MVGVPKFALDYIEPDQLGTPRMAINGSTNVADWSWSPVNDPFGETQPVNLNGSSFVLNLRFPGQSFDSESGMNYNYFRDYDPPSGRYLESDPMGLWGGISTYGYVHGNPLSHRDPFGLEDLVVEPTWNVAYPADEAYKDPAFFTVGTHDVLDSWEQPIPGEVEGPDGKAIDIPTLGDYILHNKEIKGQSKKPRWDKKKSIRLIICGGGRPDIGGALAQYLANQIGAPVTVSGDPGDVTLYSHLDENGNIDHVRAEPSKGPGQWQSFTRSPQN
jgi:RHS repeat-associated protein